MSSEAPAIDGMLPGRTLPVIDVDNAAFFEASARGELLVQRCVETGRFQHYPRAKSVYSLGEIEWVRVSGKATIYSYTIIRKNPADPAFAKLVPYALALVELPEGVRMMGNVTGCPVDDIHIGMPVEVYFSACDEAGKVHLPFWKPAT